MGDFADFGTLQESVWGVISLIRFIGTITYSRTILKRW